MILDPQTGEQHDPLSEQGRALLRERYTPQVPGPCRVCGADMRIVAASGRTTTWACTATVAEGMGMSPRARHYGESRYQTHNGDPNVIALLDAYEATL